MSEYYATLITAYRQRRSNRLKYLWCLVAHKLHHQYGFPLKECDKCGMYVGEIP